MSFQLSFSASTKVSGSAVRSFYLYFQSSRSILMVFLFAYDRKPSSRQGTIRTHDVAACKMYSIVDWKYNCVLEKRAIFVALSFSSGANKSFICI